MSEEDKENNYPEIGEIVIATVESSGKYGALVRLDEYGDKEGMVHLREVSLKWVRNIHDYVKEGQKVVLKVINLNIERGHIDLSLRRVTKSEGKAKLQLIKKRQRSNKLLEFFAECENRDREEIKNEIGGKIIEKFGDLYDGLEKIAYDNERIKELELPENIEDKLLDLINNNITPPSVNIGGYIEMYSNSPKGVDMIKRALKKIYDFREKNKKKFPSCSVKITYIASPKYQVDVSAPDYKSGELFLEGSLKQCTDYFKRYTKKYNGKAQFHRSKK